MPQLFGPGDVGQYTDGTKIILSFGSSKGGFYFALHLREEIYKHFKMNKEQSPAFVYMDTASISKNPNMQWTWDQIWQEFRGINKYWKEYWAGGAKKAKTIIFLATGPWLGSKACGEEFDFYKKNLSKNTEVTGIFVVFPDARQSWYGYADRDGSLMSKFMGLTGFKVCEVTSPQGIGSVTREPGILEGGVPIVMGGINYSLDDREMSFVLGSIRAT